MNSRTIVGIGGFPNESLLEYVLGRARGRRFPWPPEDLRELTLAHGLVLVALVRNGRHRLVRAPGGAGRRAGLQAGRRWLCRRRLQSAALGRLSTVSSGSPPPPLVRLAREAHPEGESVFGRLRPFRSRTPLSIYRNAEPVPSFLRLRALRP